MANKISEAEIKRIIFMILIGLGLYLTSFGINNWLEAKFGNGSLMIGVAIIIFVAWKFDLRKFYRMPKR